MKAELPFGPIMNGFESRPFKKDINVQNRTKQNVEKKDFEDFGVWLFGIKKKEKVQN